MSKLTSSFLNTTLISLALALSTSCASSKKADSAKAEPAKASAAEPAKSTVAAMPEAKKEAAGDEKGKKSGHHKGHHMKAEAAAPAKAEAAAKSEASSAGTLTCKNGGETRTIEVATVGAGCETRYNKGGEAKAVATAKSGTQYCQQVSDKIKGKIEGSGFKCN